MSGKQSYEERQQELEDLSNMIASFKEGNVQLEDMKARERLILATLPMAFYIAYPYGDYGGTWVSEQIEAISGFPAHMFVEDPGLWAARLHPDDRQRVLSTYDALAERETITNEYRWQVADDSYKWILDSATIIRDAEEQPLHIVGTWLDITESKQVQEDVEKSNLKYRELVDMLPQIVFEADLQGNLTFVNNQAYALTGYSPEDFAKGVNAIALLAEEDRQKAAENLQLILAGNVPLRGNEYTLMRKDGSRFPILAHSIPNRSGETAVGFRGIIVDISSLKEAEAALQKNKALLSTTIENLPCDFFALDKSSRYTMQNSTCRKKWGNIIGKKPEDLGLQEDALSLFVANNKKALAGETIAQEMEIQIGDRKEFAYNVIAPVVSGDEILGIVGINIDISERKKTELALFESRQNYKDLSQEFRALLDAIPDSLTLQDSEFRIVWANQWVADRLGKSAEELIGHYCYEIMHARSEPCTNCPAPVSMQSGKPGEGQVIDDDGTIWNMRSMPLFDEGKSARFIELGREITEHRKTENALRDSEERYRTLFESASDIIHVVDTEGRLQYVNASWSQILGYSKDEAIGMDVYGILDKGCVDECRNHFQDALAAGRVEHVETVFRTRDGRKVHLEGSLSTKYTDGNPDTVQCILRDVTERKKLVAEIGKAQKLESIGVLAGGIAHDFNNILTAISGNISLARRYAEPGETIHEKLGKAENALLRARDLTQQLLTFSKGGEPVIQTISIEDIIRDSCSFALRGSNVKCEFNLPGKIWAVQADAGQISQVVQNLIINADQAMPGGGQITITLKNVDIGIDRNPGLTPGPYVAVQISDQGYGIEKENLVKIFDPYFSTKEKGHGLGLASAYSILKNHNGLLRVKSEPGKGAEFTFYLPASFEKPSRQEGPDSTLHTGQGLILLMDDEDGVRDVAAAMLGHLGYEVHAASDGQEALEMYIRAEAAGKPYAAVIMDLTVPGGLGGKETLSKLLEIDPSVKAIVSSGYANNSIMANYESYGFAGVVPKPYRIQELGTVLNEVLAG